MQAIRAMRDRPCRHFCNRRDCAPTKCMGIIVYGRDDPRFWLGRGSEDVPGKSFGWAHNMERRAIREHLKSRGRWRDARDEFTVSKIQQRLQREYHRRKPPIGVRRTEAGPARPEPFTAEELAHIAEHFAGANDPLAQSIWRKAAGL